MLYFIGRCWKEIDIAALQNNFKIIKKASGAGNDGAGKGHPDDDFG